MAVPACAVPGACGVTSDGWGISVSRAMLDGMFASVIWPRARVWIRLSEGTDGLFRISASPLVAFQSDWTFCSAPAATPSSFVLSAPVISPASDVDAAVRCASEPVELVISSESPSRFATDRFVTPPPPPVPTRSVPHSTPPAVFFRTCPAVPPDGSSAAWT